MKTIGDADWKPGDAVPAKMPPFAAVVGVTLYPPDMADSEYWASSSAGADAISKARQRRMVHCISEGSREEAWC